MTTLFLINKDYFCRLVFCVQEKTRFERCLEVDMSKFTKILLTLVLTTLVAFALSFAIVYFVFAGQDINLTLHNGYLWSITGVLVLLVIIYMLVQWANNKEIFKSDKKKSDKPDQQFFDSRWLTQAEMDKKYCGCWFRELKNQKAGIPLRAELTPHGLRVNLLQQDWQTLIIGTTGSGKTSAIIIPTIQILSSTKTKPSLLINDPKGELYQKDYNKLVSEGYEIRVFDLRDPYRSTRWNPMERAYLDYQRALNLRKEVKVHHGDNPADTPKIKIISDTYNTEWYEFNHIAYPNKESLEMEIKALSQQLITNAQETLNDLATVLCPNNPNESDPQWTNGARDFINAVMLAMLEDSADPRLGMTKERFNLFNVYNICSLRDPGKKQYETLQNYFNGRDKLSPAFKKAAPIINNAEGTTSGYMGIVSQSISIFADDGVSYATSADELHFDDIADKPTAIFIKVPDEKENRHSIAAMLILQLYKTLVGVAEQNARENGGNQTLPRPVYMILDEFGNLPAIPKLNSVITVGRGRKIIMIMAVQDFNQLNQNYGDGVAQTVRSNCNVQIYVGTSDPKTKEEFSQRCGQTSVDVKNTSESKGKDSNSKTTSTSKASRALITPDELGLLKRGEIIISIYGDYAMRTTFTQYFNAPQYDQTIKEDEYVPSKYLDKDLIYYDVKRRNNIVLEQDIDDDFDF